MIAVDCTVPAYEKNGTEEYKRDALSVYGHWNRPEMVVLKWGTEAITVSARDLRAAIENATNTARY